MTTKGGWAEDTDDKVELGPTGKHPDGKLSEADEGELQFAVGVTKAGDVFLDFGTQVKWVAFEPGQAIEIAKMIAANAQKAVHVRQILEKQKAETVIVDGKPLKG